MTPEAGAEVPAPDVELRLPGDSAFVSVLRTTTAALAARLDFTLDDIEDLRIAVGEASALVLDEADPGSDLRCRFSFTEPGASPGAAARMTVVLSVRSTDPVEPDRHGFAWQVLTTLATGAEPERSPGSFGVRLSMTSSLAPRI